MSVDHCRQSYFPLLELLLANYVHSAHPTPVPGLHQLDLRLAIEARNKSFTQLLAAVDERVHYLMDSYPHEKLDTHRYGLFASWDPSDPAESILPSLDGSDADESDGLELISGTAPNEELFSFGAMKDLSVLDVPSTPVTTKVGRMARPLYPRPRSRTPPVADAISTETTTDNVTAVPGDFPTSVSIGPSRTLSAPSPHTVGAWPRNLKGIQALIAVGGLFLAYVLRG